MQPRVRIAMIPVDGESYVPLQLGPESILISFVALDDISSGEESIHVITKFLQI